MPSAPALVGKLSDSAFGALARFLPGALALMRADGLRERAVFAAGVRIFGDRDYAALAVLARVRGGLRFPSQASAGTILSLARDHGAGVDPSVLESIFLAPVSWPGGMVETGSLHADSVFGVGRARLRLWAAACAPRSEAALGRLDEAFAQIRHGDHEPLSEWVPLRDAQLERLLALADLADEARSAPALPEIVDRLAHGGDWGRLGAFCAIVERSAFGYVRTAPPQELSPQLAQQLGANTLDRCHPLSRERATGYLFGREKMWLGAFERAAGAPGALAALVQGQEAAIAFLGRNHARLEPAAVRQWLFSALCSAVGESAAAEAWSPLPDGELGSRIERRRLMDAAGARAPLRSTAPALGAHTTEAARGPRRV
jgi:hypothetical protein